MTPHDAWRNVAVFLAVATVVASLGLLLAGAWSWWPLPASMAVLCWGAAAAASLYEHDLRWYEDERR